MSMNLTDAEAAEVLELLKDVKSKYGQLDGDWKTLASDVAALKKARSSGGAAAAWQEPTFRERLQGAKEFLGRPIPMPRGTVINVAAIQSKDILNVSRGVPELQAPIAGGPRRQLRAVSFIPQSETTAGAVAYMRESAFTNSAAPVAEGAAKPKSDKTLLPVTKPIETIAHYFKVSKQCYEDLAGLAALIESNGLYGIDLKIDQQVLKGTGTSPELGPGLYVAATAAATLPTATPMIDRLFMAVAEVNAQGWQANGIVMSDADLTAMLLSKDTTGRYLGVTSLPLPQIATSPALAAGEWLVGDFTQAHLFVREQSSVQVASMNEDDFVRNMLTILVETRLALATYQVSAFRKNGTLSGLTEFEAPAPPERSRKS